MVKFTNLIFKETENNKCYVKYIFWKVFKNPIKLWKSPFPVMLQNFLTKRALKGHLRTRRGFQGLSKRTPKAIQGLSKDSWVLDHLSAWGIQALEGHLNTQGICWGFSPLQKKFIVKHLLQNSFFQSIVFSRTSLDCHLYKITVDLI